MNAATTPSATVVLWMPAPGLSASSFADKHSSFGFVGKSVSWGHLALRTYTGGAGGNGEYLSFFGGNPACSCGYEDRMGSHFHTVENDDDDCYLRGIRDGFIERQEIHLNGLDVAAINQKIKEIRSAKGKKAWGIQGNCSDLVLDALRAGTESSSDFYLRPYGLKTQLSMIFLSLPSLFFIRHVLTESRAAAVQDEFVLKFLVSLFPSFNLNSPMGRKTFELIHVVLGPNVFEWLLLSSLNTKRIPGKLNPTFEKRHIDWLAENHPITVNGKVLDQKQEAETGARETIKTLALSFIDDKAAQTFFAHLSLSITGMHERMLNSPFFGGTFATAIASGWLSTLYFLMTLRKHPLSFEQKLKTSMQDGALVALSSFLIQNAFFKENSTTVAKIEAFMQRGFHALSGRLPLHSSIGSDNTPSLARSGLRVLMVAAIPVAVLSFLNYYRDILVTPDYVFKLAAKFQKQQETKSSEEVPIASPTLPNPETFNVASSFSLFNKKTLLLGGAVLASAVLLFYDTNKFKITTSSPTVPLT